MSKQYDKCPVCDSTNIETGDWEVEEDFLFMEKFCMECDAIWYEVYEFIHNENEMGDILFD
jgi:hypothetical protein